MNVNIVLILEKYLTDIANSIRKKNNKIDKYKPSEMPEAIGELGPVKKYQPRKISFYNYSGDNLNYELGNLDISRITNMNYMFFGCSKLTTLDVSQWDVSKVTDMSYMFFYCKKITTLDVSKWDVSNVTDMASMFYGMYASNTFTLGNQTAYEYGISSIDVSNWDVSKVTNMSYMFHGCGKLTTLDLSNWNVSKVTNMNSMFDMGFVLFAKATFVPLSDNSLKSVLKMLKTATSLSASNKNLKYLGLTSDQATKCTTFTEWNDLVALGWTTGY